VEKLLQHVLSTRGLPYDSLTLKPLLLWAQRSDLIPTVERLWEEVTTGSKEVSKFSTVQRLIFETLKEMRAEKGAAATAFAALTLERGSASAMLFAGPSIPLAPVHKKKEGRGTTETASESVAAGSQSEGEGLPPEFSPLPARGTVTTISGNTGDAEGRGEGTSSRVAGQSDRRTDYKIGKVAGDRAATSA